MKTHIDRAAVALVTRGFLGDEVAADLRTVPLGMLTTEVRGLLEVVLADVATHGTLDRKRILSNGNGGSDTWLRLLSDGMTAANSLEQARANLASALLAGKPVSELAEPLREPGPLFESITVDKLIPPSGFLHEYISYFSEQTDAPRLYHLLMAYTTLAAVLGNRVYFTLAGDRLFPNIWVVCIGPSGIARKSTVLNKSRALVSAIDPKAVFPSDFTTEALLDILNANPRGIFYHPEFRALYGMLAKDYMSGAKALLTELYDSPAEYRRETKGRTCAIVQPVISMASATTVSWLTSRNSEDDFGGGFLARFLFVPTFKRERSLPLPPSPDPSRFKNLMRQLHRMRDDFNTPAEAKYAPEARELFIDWYKKFDDTDPFAGTPLAPFHARYQSYVHKLAMLYTVASGGKIVAMDAVAVVYATGVIEYVTKSLLLLYDRHLTFGRDDERMKKVLDSIPEGKAIPRSELLRRSRMNVKDFSVVIETLMQTDRITRSYLRGKGRTGEVYAKK